MKKIELEMCKALHKRKNWNKGNTAVRVTLSGKAIVSVNGVSIATLHRGGLLTAHKQVVTKYTKHITSRLHAMGFETITLGDKTHITKSTIWFD